jgi:hypothetical protein
VHNRQVMFLLVLPYRLKHVKLSNNYVCLSELVIDDGYMVLCEMIVIHYLLKNAYGKMLMHACCPDLLYVFICAEKV